MEKYNTLRDGHVHTPFCPHGSEDVLEAYVEHAIKIGLEAMTFTEHMPLPEGVLEQALARSSSPGMEVMLDYFQAVEKLRKKYRHAMVIATGLEVDYIEGYENNRKEMLNLYGPYLQDGLLSVHILKLGEEYVCIDDLEGFKRASTLLGSVEAVYDMYFQTLIKSVKADLGPYKPRRIGHMSLVRVFQKEFPLEYTNTALLEEVVQTIKESGMAVEFNTGGLRKPLCGEHYPTGRLRELIMQYEVPVVWGSDAHRAQDVGFGFGQI